MSSYSIRTEAKMNSNLVSDIDNFRSKYLEYDYETDISCLAPAFEIYSLEVNKFTLLRDCKLATFKNNWRMRPDYASYDLYGTVIYWPIILFANSVQSIEDFKDFEKIYVPAFSSIMQVLRNKVPSDEIEKIKEPEISAFVSYLQRSPMDDLELQKIIADSLREDFNAPDTTTSTVPTTVIDSQSTVVTPSILALMALQLANVPTHPSETSLIINDSEPYIYDTDYTVKDQNIISWDPSDVPSTTINPELDDVVTVTYEHDIINEFVYGVTLTATDLTNFYVTLPFNPINNSSIEFYIDGFSVPQRYGYDYILKNNNIISWDVDEVRTSILYDSLLDGDNLIIKFLYKYSGEEEI